MRNLVLFFVGCSFLFSAHAEDYHTQKNCAFVQVNDSQFGPTWKAPNGVIWSQYLGNFDNSGTQGQRIESTAMDYVMTDSTAVNVCKNLKSTLPTLAQFQDLLECFQDAKDFHHIFPASNGASELYWTINTPIQNYVRFARVMPYLDPYGDVTGAVQKLSVMCIH